MGFLGQLTVSESYPASLEVLVVRHTDICYQQAQSIIEYFKSNQTLKFSPFHIISVFIRYILILSFHLYPSLTSPFIWGFQWQFLYILFTHHVTWPVHILSFASSCCSYICMAQQNWKKEKRKKRRENKYP